MTLIIIAEEKVAFSLSLFRVPISNERCLCTLRISVFEILKSKLYLPTSYIFHSQQFLNINYNRTVYNATRVTMIILK